MFKTYTLWAILENKYAPAYGWRGVTFPREYINLMKVIYKNDMDRFWEIVEKYDIDMVDLPDMDELIDIFTVEVKEDIKRGKLNVEDLMLEFFDYDDIWEDFERWLEELDDEEIEEYLKKEL
jgi:hypothetical protein